MARVTVEDCVLRVPNRFELVMLAAQRARDVSAGGALTVERDNDKNPVVALREIAEETVSIDALRNAVVQGLQKHVEIDEPEEEEEIEILSADDLRSMGVDSSLEEEIGEDDGLSIHEEDGDADIGAADVDVEDED